jgi:hypothetical protein
MFVLLPHGLREASGPNSGVVMRGIVVDDEERRPLSATGRHHQVATQLTATSALVTLARVEQWPPATIA